MRRLTFVLVGLLLGLSACRGGGGSALPPLAKTPRHTFSITPASPLQWTTGHAYSPSSVSVSFPAAPAVGDLIVVVFWNNGQSTGAANTYTPPAAWNLVDQNLNYYATYQSFSHVVGSGDANSYVFNVAAAQRAHAWIAADLGNAGAIDAAKNIYIDTSSSWTSPNVTPAQTNDLALVFHLPYYAYTWTNPAGWTVGATNTQWHGESVYQALGTLGSVSETSSYSTGAFGFSAIILVGPSGVQSTPAPTPIASATTSPTASPAPSAAPGGGPSPKQWTTGHAFSPSSITVAFASAPAAGDLLAVAFWNNGQSSGGANTYTPPAGWILADQNLNYYATYQLFWHVAASGEPNSYSFTPAQAVRAHAWNGVDVGGASKIDRANNVYVDTNTTWTTPALTPSQSNDLALAFQLPYYAYTWTNPPAWTAGATNTQWHGETLYQLLSSASGISETSTYSTATFGFSAIVLIAGSGSGATSTPVPTGPPSATPAPSAPPGTIDYATFGYDLQRTGYNASEKSIGPGSFATFHSLWPSNPNVGGTMQGEPSVAMNVNVNGTSRNLLYGGGASAVFYALDADTGAVVWSKRLSEGSYVCSGGTNFWGVEGTAAIDRPRNRIYVPDGQNNIHALDLATGAEQSGWPINIGGAAGHDFIHIAMTYNASNAYLYAGTSSTCDISPWHGRVAVINTNPTNAPSLLNTFFTEQGGSGGGVWGVGGASIDPATNNVFIAVGNADATPETAVYGEQIVELSADLSTVIDHNYPPNMPALEDSDMAATPLLFQPVGCPPLAAVVNKSGAFELYNRTNLSAGPMQQIVMSGTGDVFRGLPAYDPVTNYVYVALPDSFGIYSPGIAAFGITASCTLNATPVWNGLFGANQDLRSPITIANGVVYVGGYNENTVYAYDAASGTKLWSGALSNHAQIGPVVVNGRLYVGDTGGTIHAWIP